MRPRVVLAALAVLLAAPLAADAANPVVRFATTLGDFDVELCQEESAQCLEAAPLTVANFLSYLDEGSYGPGSFIHRSAMTGAPARPFVIQGGTWKYLDPQGLHTVTPKAPVQNEFRGFSNLRGTIAVPLLGASQCNTDENSGTSGWFVNLGENSALDCGLFTVFGVVLGNGMDVVDAIADLRIYVAATPLGLTEVPFLDSFPCPPPAPTVQCLEDLLPESPFDFLVYYTVTRVPETGAAASALATSGALAWLARRRSRAESP
jgi:peptidyl-prolyl cis-trans isomerase A (cyclophilin A)